MCMPRVQLTLEERDLRYLRSLVKSSECASLSHAVRRIIKEYRQLRRDRRREESECD